jgi:hypothetical protein
MFRVPKQPEMAFQPALPLSKRAGTAFRTARYLNVPRKATPWRRGPKLCGPSEPTLGSLFEARELSWMSRSFCAPLEPGSCSDSSVSAVGPDAQRSARGGTKEAADNWSFLIWTEETTMKLPTLLLALFFAANSTLAFAQGGAAGGGAGAGAGGAGAGGGGGAGAGGGSTAPGVHGSSMRHGSTMKHHHSTRAPKHHKKSGM